ncbi:putative zf-parp-type zinc finger protein [Neofusicoccum parvum UCRNP2]|uniref:Putative zf-parp-type zinc finger protein n=1 Tax=Botryosphaeria parva (strain UCR-NP2) TaxID=1287680 RepID=R1EMD2_BOTPV|nr:putative zf-parp-type zinc finger protein [Neofusicoccum parvum UCRNP2]
MPSGYRVEVSPNKRAGCKNSECKNAGIKIQKGELRFATMVTIQEQQSWAYKHWGCTTPKVIANVKEFIDGDLTMIDGYEDLPEDMQAKLDTAFAQGHVDDEDWKGDVEKNRPGQNGMRLTKADKKRLGIDDDEGGGSKTKKRSRKAADDEDEGEEEEAPAPKKARGKKGAKAVKNEEPADVEEDEAPAPKKARAKKATKTAKPDEENEEVEEAPVKPKKARATKKAPKAPTPEDDQDELAAEEDEEPVPAPKPKKARGKKAAKGAVDGEEEPKPAAKGRKAKAKAAPVAEENGTDEEVVEEAPKAKSAPQKRGRKAKA